MLPSLNDIELPSDSPMPAPTPVGREDFYVTVPVKLQCDGNPTLNLKPGKIGVSASGDDQTELLLQLVSIGDDFQTPAPEAIVGLLYLNEYNAARLASAITHWLAAKG